MNYRLVFMDNFYSRHTFATHLKKFSDNDIKVIGTVRCNMVDSANRDNVLKGLERVNDKPMHSWVLVRAHDTVESKSNKRRKVQSNTLDNYLNVSSSKQPSSVHPNAGYIIWKDKKSIPFYTNDLATTPEEDILDGTDERAIKAVHGLAPVKRWTGTESLQRTSVNVPAPVVAYNMFMGSVDIMDQKREATYKKRREKQLSTKIFNYILSLTCLNAHAVYNKLL